MIENIGTGLTIMNHVSERSQRIPRAGIRVIFDAAQRLQGVIHLEIGTPDLPTPPTVCDAAERAARDGLTRYTANAGSLPLREAIAAQLQLRGVPAGVDNIVVTTGGMGALASVAMMALDPGDEVLVPDPGWPNYTMQALCAGAIPVAYPLYASSGYQPQIEDLARRITPRTRMIIVNSPSNPIGTVHSEAVVGRIIEFAREKNLLVLSDEVYEYIVYSGRNVSYLRADTLDVVIGVYSFSKTYSMTGWRVGYVVASPDWAAQLTKLQEVFYACASSVSQEAARAALQLPPSYHDEVLTRYRGRRDSLVSILQSHGVGYVQPDGAFYCMIDTGQSGVDSTALALKLLESKQVAVAPGSTFGDQSASMLRVSYAVDDEVLRKGVTRLASFLSGQPG